ncbi:MAG: glutaredoxin 3 [Deltaproteobacteria bacterium]|nr:glutaredoxin 3 [Deltaproteobacteria bacterium]
MPSHVKMYTRRWCGYCTAAEHLLKEKGVAYEEVDCTGDHAIRRWLVEVTGRSTVPQIFIDDKSIGGYDELRALERRGELDDLLAGSSDPARSATPSG